MTNINNGDKYEWKHPATMQIIWSKSVLKWSLAKSSLARASGLVNKSFLEFFTEHSNHALCKSSEEIINWNRCKGSTNFAKFKFQREFGCMFCTYCYRLQLPKLIQDMEFPTRSYFYWHGLTLIPVWISNYMPGRVWDEITYPFLNFNSYTVEVWKWISNYIPHFIMDAITYPCWD